MSANWLRRTYVSASSKTKFPRPRSIRKSRTSSYLNPGTHIGQKEYDGNPIFNALERKRNRAVRIIQAAPQGENLDFSAWVDSIALSEKAAPVPELVLELVLSKESYAIAERLIRAWLVAGADREEMERLIGTEVVV